MKKLGVYLSSSPEEVRRVGELAEANRKIYFEYDVEFLEDPLWLSPFKLPVEPGLQEHRDLSFGPLFGLFDDSLPDGWGLLLMNRHFRKAGIPPETVSPLDRLAYMGIRTMGTSLGHASTNFYSVAGHRGRNEDNLQVFRRTGEPCPICSTPIQRLVVAQRGTHICPKCQCPPA